jgi:YD repeat-containing protein
VDQKYDFDYYVPLNSLNDWAAYPCKDWWGYYKMNSAQHTNPIRYPYLIRAQNANIQIPVGYDIDRTPDVESMKIGMLKAIIYPTGGRTVFDYENNQYSGTYSNTASEIGPGLRIKEVRNQPLIGQEVIRHFKYGENEDGRGHIIDALRANTNNQSEYSMMIYYDYNGYVGGNPQNPTTMPSYGQIGYRVRDYSSDFNFDYNDFGDSYTSYEFVTEYIGSEANSLRKDVYKYSLKNLTTQEYSFIDHEYAYEPVYKKIFVDPEHSWEGGKLIDKTSYVDGGLGVLSKKTYQEIYNYESFVKEFAWDMPAYRHVIFTVDRSASPNTNIYNEIYNLEKYYHENFLNVYGYGFRKYVSGEELLVQKQTIEYGADGSSISNQALFSYENQKLFPRSQTQINSKGEEQKITFQYTFDDNYINVSPHNEMVLNNIISQPVKKEQYNNDHLSQSKTTKYKKWYDYIFSPETEYFKTGGDPELPKIKFHNYDLYGGVGSVSIESGPEICYLYSYSGKFPIAKIEGGTYQQIVSILGGQSAIDIFSGFSEPTSAEINNFISPLKVNLPRTHITSYTYKPLIGMTSMTDPKGMITTFEYDDFGRVKWLKDQNGNILNENIYHYKN